ncbi:MAG TPA: DUF1365 domain-containing protein [Gammaproteobacteria bacterium]
MNPHSAIYEGTVMHRRHAPMQHAFQYRLFMLYLDLGELDQVFHGRWLWSVDRFNLAAFHRADHLGPHDVPLDTAVRDLVLAKTGWRPEGLVRLLTHARYFGYCMNPVSFYYCWDRDDRAVEAIVAEINNTPWGERHCYVLDHRTVEGASHRYRFEKNFHVSPFFGMDYQYDWRFSEPGSQLTVAMRNLRDGVRDFEAAMVLKRRPLTGPNLARTLLRYPFMTGRVITAIYWQALRLWCKGAVFHSHPRTYEPGEK